MSQTSGTVRCWVLIGAMALAAPALAGQLASNISVNEIAPFRALNSSGGLCNSAQAPSGNPVIQIDNTGLDEFTVTGILIKTSGVPAGSGVVSLSIDRVAINGVEFDTRTESLLGPTDGSAVFESVDLMGTLVRRGALGSRVAQSGGNFPHQIVAKADLDSPDIEITMSCRSDFEDFSITAIAVSGWKFKADGVTVTYIPGD